jgi:hypothetical protein
MNKKSKINDDIKNSNLETAGEYMENPGQDESGARQYELKSGNFNT